MIHVDFKDFQDMLSFARQLLGQVEGEKAMQPQRQPVMQQTPVVPTQPAAPATPVQATVPTTSVTYTPDDLARAAFALMDSGRQQELIGLLQQFGVNAIPELKPEQYGAFATALRGMGAQI